MEDSPAILPPPLPLGSGRRPPEPCITAFPRCLYPWGYHLAMAAGNAVRSYHSTTAGTGAETVGLQQFWDTIEVQNKDDASTLYFTVDGTTAVAAAAGTFSVPPGGAKIVGPGGIQNENGVPGGTTTALCHTISIITGEASNAYGVEGQTR